MSTQIRLGIIGTGLAVEKLHWPALKRMPEKFTVTAFTNRSKAKAEHFAEYSGSSMDGFVETPEALLARDDVDAVLISLPIPLNYPMTKAAVEAGKHVICEKPPGVDLAEGLAYIKLERAHPERKILVAENYFYRDDVRYVKSLLEGGIIGRVHLMNWRVIHQLIPREGQFSITPWRHHIQYAGGAHLDAGVHHTAQIRMLLGDVARLNGEIQDSNTTHDGPSDLSLNMKFVSGAVGNYTAAYPEIQTPTDGNDMRIYGTAGTLTFDGRGLIKIYRPDGSIETHTVSQPDGGYTNEFTNFHEAVVDNAPIVGNAAQSYRTMEMALRGIESAEAGQVITLEDDPEPLAAIALPTWTPGGGADLFNPAFASVKVEVSNG